MRLGRIASTSRTIAFTNTVWVVDKPWPPGPPAPSMIEHYEALAPSWGSPSIHFRHLGRVANVAFVDGHVEAWTDPTRKLPQSWVPAEMVAFRDAENVFDIGTTDELWDLD